MACPGAEASEPSQPSYSRCARWLGGRTRTGCLLTKLWPEKAYYPSAEPNPSYLQAHAFTPSSSRSRASSAHNCMHVTITCMQDDVLFPNLTVRETFDFAAAISLPRTVSAAAKRELTARVITELGLARVANSFIGVGAWIMSPDCARGLGIMRDGMAEL